MKSEHQTTNCLVPHLLSIWVMLSASAAAQNPDFTSLTIGHAGDAIELRSGCLIIAKGSEGPALLPSDQGAGTRFLWYPSKGSFRAGRVDDSQWDHDNIGECSVALGYSTIASGYFATSLGLRTTASNYASLATGYESIASGYYSTAMGVASDASGGASIAMGESPHALGWASIAMGGSSVANNSYATAMGLNSNASGYVSTAIGCATAATGEYTTAMGLSTVANSACSTAIGRLNIGGGNSEAWLPEDPLFEIGNGTPEAAEYPYAYHPAIPSNALTVYKNGNMDVQGMITCAPGGDIPMFTGN